MIKVFVSGCFDILHGGHIELFRQARAMGDHLTVSFASAEVLRFCKGREAALPDAHKRVLLESIRYIDQVVMGTELHSEDFRGVFLELKPDIMVVTEDDRFESNKRALCAMVGAQYVKIPRITAPGTEPWSTTETRRRVSGA